MLAKNQIFKTEDMYLWVSYKKKILNFYLFIKFLKSLKKVVGSGSAPLVNAYTAFKGRGYEVLGLRQRNTCRKVPLQVIFLHDILHCLLWVLSFYARRIVTCRDRLRSYKLQVPVLHKMFSLSWSNAELLLILSSQVNVSHGVFDSTIWSDIAVHITHIQRRKRFSKPLWANR